MNFPNTVTYVMEVSGGPSVCELPQPVQAQIQFVRFGTVTVEINFQCDCVDCEAPVSETNSHYRVRGQYKRRAL